ncbi:hypothetical protein ANN_15386 [Periplaneta americana]|uniref:Uncharacterized protein n=1 Tax=Periplaneta americana TaxID=6978 RepID=A0ABQ8SGY1_PERAM|nr:hypothetical protein ANN_15386 [Periplaneta americana]
MERRKELSSDLKKVIIRLALKGYFYRKIGLYYRHSWSAAVYYRERTVSARLHRHRYTAGEALHITNATRLLPAHDIKSLPDGCVIQSIKRSYKINKHQVQSTDKFISGIEPGPSQWFFHFGEEIVIAWAHIGFVIFIFIFIIIIIIIIIIIHHHHHHHRRGRLMD